MTVKEKYDNICIKLDELALEVGVESKDINELCDKIKWEYISKNAIVKDLKEKMENEGASDNEAKRWLDGIVELLLVQRDEMEKSMKRLGIENKVIDIRDYFKYLTDRLVKREEAPTECKENPDKCEYDLEKDIEEFNCLLPQVPSEAKSFADYLSKNTYSLDVALKMSETLDKLLNQMMGIITRHEEVNINYEASKRRANK